MNQPMLTALDAMLKALGSESTQLGSGSIGLIAAPFTPSPHLTLANLTEANFSGYARQAIGNPSIPFSGSDGNEYVEGLTVQFSPSDTITPNTIYGHFFTFGNSSASLYAVDSYLTPVFLASPANRLTITPRFGANPSGNWGTNVVSN